MSVASALVEAITRRAKARQVEKIATAFSRYKQEILIPAAADKTIDIDTLEILLEANERRPEDFGGDVEAYKGRVVDRATMDRIPVLQNQQRQTESQRDKLLAELQAAMDRLNPQIRQCVEQLRGIETQLASCAGSEGRLLASVMDPGLLARQAELNERRKEVGARLREATERRNEADKYRRHYEVTIEGLDSQFEATDRIGRRADEIMTPGVRGEKRAALQEARQALTQAIADLKARQSEVDAIEAEMREVDRDASKLHAEMLIP